MDHPYSNLNSQSFWRSAIADKSCFDISNLWEPKFRFDRLPIYTAGSCFAQHFGRALSQAGLKWINAEPAPIGASKELRRKFNYDVFSTRTANIYTTPMLRQWLEICFGDAVWDEVWHADNRFFDPLRPLIEPNGFSSLEEFKAARNTTTMAIRKSLEDGCIFVFTLGLTESWVNTQTGMHYAACPGTQAGTFDAEKHVFKNLSFNEIRKDLKSSIQYILRANPRNRVLLTVSPVPLTATASGDHVLTATIRSKSILRAVAASVSEGTPKVDYFPSYEIITGTPFRSMWFAPNMRSVRQEGVDFVMKNFFADHQRAFGAMRTRLKHKLIQDSEASEDVVCEEALLDAFGDI